jgi:4-hydroxythreonine-4-phosphate dehydrogenase
MQSRAKLLGLTCDWPIHEEAENQAVSIVPVPCAVIPTPGSPTPDNAAYLLKTLLKGAEGCLNHAFSALVTGPVGKSIIEESGISFRGHTDFFAHLTESPCTVMTFLTDFCPVGLMTTHLPLRMVADAISTELVLTTATTLLNGLQTHFGVQNPHLAICGLNPHAGENGHLGREEIEIMAPAIEQLRAKGYRISGPLSADSVFTSNQRGQYDGILSPYHDQALTAVKALGFGDGVQITLGLPFLRVSVDHGTALNLAGTGQASCASLLKALQSAQKILKKDTSL